MGVIKASSNGFFVEKPFCAKPEGISGNLSHMAVSGSYGQTNLVVAYVLG